MLQAEVRVDVIVLHNTTHHSTVLHFTLTNHDSIKMGQWSKTLLQEAFCFEVNGVF